MDSAAAWAEFELLATEAASYQKPGPLHMSAWHCHPWLSRMSRAGGSVPDGFRQFIRAVEKHGEDLAAVRRRLRQVSRRIAIPPPRIEIRALGASQVVRDGRALTLSDWQTREVHDLFFYLLFSPPQTKEQIALVFWPDISPARLKTRFKSDIYRVRQALGQNVITFEDEFYQVNRSIDYLCDVDEFRTLLADARGSTELQRTLILLQRATDLVQGPFLADMDAPWVGEIRSRLAGEYYDALFELAQAYLAVGDPENCLLVSQKAIALDPLQERVYRLRMNAFAALRDRPGLARQYQQCKEIFQRELGILPSHETAMLYERLLG
jgi:two-component SAPR family response regulator